MKTTAFILFAGALLAASASFAQAKTESAVFAGGCFWCMTPPFEKLAGVLKVTAGYADGQGENPTYEDYGDKGYTEGVSILYDPSKVTYRELVDVFWKQINPTDPNGQFVDRGPHYRAAVFYLNEAQKKAAGKSKADLDKSGRYNQPIVVPIKKFVNFVPAEEYHQDYYKKNPFEYGQYHDNSGRNEYLDSIWGKGNH
jgi:peptide methionine sulfoxide reductase msrA/msrB